MLLSFVRKKLYGFGRWIMMRRLRGCLDWGLVSTRWLEEGDVKLNLTQLKYLPAIRWFLSDDVCDIRTGRSYLLAVVYVMMALDSPGKRFYVRDLAFNVRNDKALLMFIYSVASSSNIRGRRFHCNYADCSFKIEEREAVEVKRVGFDMDIFQRTKPWC